MFPGGVNVASAVVYLHAVSEEKSPKTCTGVERSNYNIALCGDGGGCYECYVYYNFQAAAATAVIKRTRVVVGWLPDRNTVLSCTANTYGLVQ